MTRKELQLIKPLLSPMQYRTVEFMQKAGRYVSYAEINAGTHQTCCWKRLSEIGNIWWYNTEEIDIAMCKVFDRTSRWKESKNAYGDTVRFKQFRLA